MDINVGDKVTVIINKKINKGESLKDYTGTIEHKNKKFLTINSEEGYKRTLSMSELLTGEVEIELNGKKLKLVQKKKADEPVINKTDWDKNPRSALTTREELLELCKTHGIDKNGCEKIAVILGAKYMTIKTYVQRWGIAKELGGATRIRKAKEVPDTNVREQESPAVENLKKFLDLHEEDHIVEVNKKVECDHIPEVEKMVKSMQDFNRAIEGFAKSEGVVNAFQSISNFAKSYREAIGSQNQVDEFKPKIRVVKELPDYLL